MQISKRLMNGMVLMYHGTEIVNYDGQSADHYNTLGLKYWYCMNNLSGQPDIRNKFPRCESTAGNEDGHDDDQLIAHTHTIGSGGVNHLHSLSTTSSHTHSSLSQGITWNSSNRSYIFANLLKGILTYDTTLNGAHTHNATTSNGNHSHTLETTGVSPTGKNMPKYSGLQFIRRSR